MLEHVSELIEWVWLRAVCVLGVIHHQADDLTRTPEALLCKKANGTRVSSPPLFYLILGRVMLGRRGKSGLECCRYGQSSLCRHASGLGSLGLLRGLELKQGSAQHWARWR
jgi:hypothetical protein